jgi:hypothetical protein
MKIILASLLLFMSFPSNAFTGNELYENFKEMKKPEPEINYARIGQFVGYVTGVTDVYFEYGLLCWPDGATTGQSFDIVGKYLKINPESRNEIASVLVYLALKPIYPCEEE